MAIGDPIIDILGISWVLHVEAVATLSYDHPDFGTLTYTGNAESPWLCDNTNTLTLTSSGSLPAGVLPPKVCVRPKYDAAGCGCYDLNPYTVPEDQKACCDPGCSFEFPLFLTCGDVTESCLATFTVGGGNGLDGIEDHSGPTYGACCTLIGVELCVNLYCNGTDWLADIYMDDSLCETFNCGPPTECCPLVITGGTADTCNYCTPCIGEECEEPPIQTDCCAETIPATLTVTISSDECPAVEGTFTVTYQDSIPEGPDGGWVGAFTMCSSNPRVVIYCDNGTWNWRATGFGDDCGDTSIGGTLSGTCDPFIIDGGDDFEVDGCCDSCVTDDFFNITVTP